MDPGVVGLSQPLIGPPLSSQSSPSATASTTSDKNVERLTFCCLEGVGFHVTTLETIFLHLVSSETISSDSYGNSKLEVETTELNPPLEFARARSNTSPALRSASLFVSASTATV